MKKTFVTDRRGPIVFSGGGHGNLGDAETWARAFELAAVHLLTNEPTGVAVTRRELMEHWAKHYAQAASDLRELERAAKGNRRTALGAKAAAAERQAAYFRAQADFADVQP